MRPSEEPDSCNPSLKPWLSILIPVYNVEQYLTECFESFMDQIDPAVEVIAVEDCSTDDSPLILDQLRQRWPGRIRVVHHSVNSGLSAARNTMLDIACGDYLWFIDSDDVVEPGALSQLRMLVEQQGPDLVLCDYRVLREKPKLRHRLRGEAHRRTFNGVSGSLQTDRLALYCGVLLAGHMHVWSKITHRRLWQDGLRFPVGRFYEDLYVTPRIAARAKSFHHCPRVWIGYRQRSSSILGQLNARKLQDLMRNLDGLSSDLDAAGLAGQPEARFALSHTCARSMIAALRGLQRLRAEPAALTRAREAFHRASPLPPSALIRAYLSRGWWARALRLAWWLRQPA